MKISLALGQQRPLDRATAWACLTTNILAPGSGSLVAGKKIGYAQLAVAFCGLGATFVLGIKFFLWYADNWSRLRQPSDDPLAALGEVFRHLWRGPMVGIGIFAVAIAWALVSSLQILAAARRASTPSQPPRLK